MSDEQRDKLVKTFAYEWVCFNHDVNDKFPYLVTDVTDDCMIELEGMSGLFAPTCFHRVPAPPTPGADGRYCRHHDDDPAHGKDCYQPTPDLAPVAEQEIHWQLKAGVEETMCGVSVESEEGIKATLLPDRATCKACESAVWGYQCGRADERSAASLQPPESKA